MSQNGLHNPFPGLRAFEPEEDYLFFGREKETDDLRRRLRTSRFLAVIGSSGSGKSSLVKSGLIPSLHAGFMAQAGSSWRIAMLRPGEDPIGNLVKALQVSEVVPAMSAMSAANQTVLAVTLRDSSLGVAEAVKHAMLPRGDNLLVVVDQFEELFRFNRSRTKHNEDEAVAFVKLLLDAAHQDYAAVYVVITMRSEFIGDCMPFPGLPEAINEGLYLTPRMSRDEMRAAITKPVAVSGATIAPRLVVRLLNEVGDEMDRLPVLQHALMRTWDNWKAESGLHTNNRQPATDNRQPIDLRHYEAIGTMKAALSQHGEEAYNDLPSKRAQAIAERLFKTITDTTEEGRGVRNPAPLGRIAAVCAATEPEVAEIVETFRQPGRAFLQPPKSVPLASDSIIDISHESLMRLWNRLIGWTKEEARSTEIYHRLAYSAERHATGEESLWRNPQLQIGLRWRQENRPTADWAGHEQGFIRSMRFLDCSNRAHLLRRAVLIAAVLLVIVGLAGWVYRQYSINRELQAKLAVLSGAQQAAALEVGAGAREVAELRSKNEKLKAEVAAAQEQRESLTESIQALRKDNQTVEQNLVALNQENEQLTHKINSLQKEEIALSNEQGDLEELDRELSRQGSILTREVQLLTEEKDSAKARADRLVAKAAWLGYRDGREGPGMAAAPHPSLDLPKDEKAVIFALPADIPDNDALRKQIEDLQRQLDELRAERAKQVDEAGWLKKENALLEQQRIALLDEVQALERTKEELTKRQQNLQQMVAVAEKHAQALKQRIARAESANAKTRQEVETLRTKTRESQEESINLADGINVLRRWIGAQNAESEKAESVINRATSRLIQLVDQEVLSADTSGLLAVAAWRLASDPNAPNIYTPLLLALRRLDEKAAQALLSAQTNDDTTKIGTTTSAILAQAICARIKRGFTQEEWRTYFPPGADFNSRLARPCAEK